MKFTQYPNVIDVRVFQAGLSEFFRETVSGKKVLDIFPEQFAGLNKEVGKVLYAIIKIHAKTDDCGHIYIIRQSSDSQIILPYWNTYITGTSNWWASETFIPLYCLPEQARLGIQNYSPAGIFMEIECEIVYLSKRDYNP